VLESFSQLVDPECPIPPDVIRIHGITNAMTTDMPTVSQTLPRFVEFLGGPETILLAHNAPFDLGFLAMALTKSAIPFPSHRVIDTLDLARTCLQDLPNYRLETVAFHLRIADREDHRALSDAGLAIAVPWFGVARRDDRAVADGDVANPTGRFGTHFQGGAVAAEDAIGDANVLGGPRQGALQAQSVTWMGEVGKSGISGGAWIESLVIVGSGPDQKIYSTGHGNNGYGTSSTIIMACYNEDGSLDTDFASPPPPAP
jgi:hypothetical protein